MRRLLALAACLAFCSSAVAASTRSRSMVTVRSSSFGSVLFDGRGFVLYGFTRDPRSRSVCTGTCASAWPPYLVKTRATAGPGVRAKLLGTTKRRDGKVQVTYAGRPLYYYVGDRKPGQILCQNV